VDGGTSGWCECPIFSASEELRRDPSVRNLLDVASALRFNRAGPAIAEDRMMNHLDHWRGLQLQP
jgi:hypothetical protein